MGAALCRCDSVGLRDKPSLDLARQLLPPHKGTSLRAEADLALPTRAATPERVAFLLRHYRLGERFAIIAPKGTSGRGAVRILTTWLCSLRAEGVRLVFVPLYPKEDLPLCRQLSLHEEDRILTGLSPSDLVGLMGQVEVVCGMRLHALIFAASAEAPFVGFGTDPKIRAFCEENGGVYFTDLYG